MQDEREIETMAGMWPVDLDQVYEDNFSGEGASIEYLIESIDCHGFVSRATDYVSSRVNREPMKDEEWEEIVFECIKECYHGRANSDQSVFLQGIVSQIIYHYRKFLKGE